MNGTRMVRPGVEGAGVAAEPLDDAGPGLRDDPHGLGQRDEHQQRDCTPTTPRATSEPIRSPIRRRPRWRRRSARRRRDCPASMMWWGSNVRADQTSPLSLTRPPSAVRPPRGRRPARRPGRRCRCGSRRGVRRCLRAIGRTTASIATDTTRKTRICSGALSVRMPVTPAASAPVASIAKTRSRRGDLDDAEEDREPEPGDPVVVPEAVHARHPRERATLSPRTTRSPHPLVPPPGPASPTRRVASTTYGRRVGTLRGSCASQSTHLPAIRGRTAGRPEAGGPVRWRGRSSGGRSGRAPARCRRSRPARWRSGSSRSGRRRRPGRRAAAARG